MAQVKRPRVLKADGTPDMRYKNARIAVAVGKVYGKKKAAPKKAAPIYRIVISNGRISLLRNNRNMCDRSPRFDNTIIGCGIKQIAGVSTLEELYRHGAPKNMVDDGIKRLLLAIKNSKRATFVAISNNNRTPYTNAVLDKMAISQTPYTRSVGTGNQVKVWVI